MLCESSTQGTRQLGAEVEREIWLVLVEQTELSALVGVDDSKNTGDRFADIVAGEKVLVSANER